MNDSDLKYVELAKYVSTWSKDTSTKIGAVLVKNNTVVGIGYNRFPIGVDDTIFGRYERPQKYLYTEHAERVAIYNANKNGISTNDCSIYISKMFPCSDCARAIIECGIDTIYCNEPNFDDERWGENFKVSYIMLTESKIKLIYHNF